MCKATTTRAENATVNDVDKAGVSCLCTLRYTLISIRRVAFIMIYTSALRVRKRGRGRSLTHGKCHWSQTVIEAYVNYLALTELLQWLCCYCYCFLLLFLCSFCTSFSLYWFFAAAASCSCCYYCRCLAVAVASVVLKVFYFLLTVRSCSCCSLALFFPFCFILSLSHSSPRALPVTLSGSS